MTTWEYFSKRRNVILQDFIKAEEFDTYEKLQAFCQDRNLYPPPLEKYAEAHSNAFQVVAKKKVKVPVVEKKKVKAPSKVPVTKAPPQKKRVYTRRKKVVNKK